MTGLLILGYVLSGIKLIWALTVPVVIYMVCRKIWFVTPKWITYGLIFVAIVNFHTIVPVLLSRVLSVTQFGIVQMFSNILNSAGAIVFLVVVYGMASVLKSNAQSTAQTETSTARYINSQT